MPDVASVDESLNHKNKVGLRKNRQIKYADFMEGVFNEKLIK